MTAPPPTRPPSNGSRSNKTRSSTPQPTPGPRTSSSRTTSRRPSPSPPPLPPATTCSATKSSPSTLLPRRTAPRATPSVSTLSSVVTAPTAPLVPLVPAFTRLVMRVLSSTSTQTLPLTPSLVLSFTAEARRGRWPGNCNLGLVIEMLCCISCRWKLSELYEVCINSTQLSIINIRLFTSLYILIVNNSHLPCGALLLVKWSLGPSVNCVARRCRCI